MGTDMSTCIVFGCGKPKDHMHHVVHGTANRKVSDNIGYPFVIPLCAEHHAEIHKDMKMNKFYKKMAQNYFEQNLGNRELFIELFGKSYL